MLGSEPDEESDLIKIEGGPRVICEVETVMTACGTDWLNRFE